RGFDKKSPFLQLVRIIPIRKESLGQVVHIGPHRDRMRHAKYPAIGHRLDFHTQSTNIGQRPFAAYDLPEHFLFVIKCRTHGVPPFWSRWIKFPASSNAFCTTCLVPSGAIVSSRTWRPTCPGREREIKTSPDVARTISISSEAVARRIVR